MRVACRWVRLCLKVAATALALLVSIRFAPAEGPASPGVQTGTRVATDPQPGTTASSVYGLRDPGTGPGESLKTAPRTDDGGDTVEALKSLGYFDTAPTENPEDRGVTVDKPGAFSGYNLISSRHRATAHLTDMQGHVLHTWTDTHRAPWMHVEVQPNGDLVALAKDAHLLRTSWNSQVLWRVRSRVHHDFTVLDDDSMLVLSRDAKWQLFGGTRLPVLTDKVVHVTSEGQIAREISIFEVLRPFIKPSKVARLRRDFRRKKSFHRLAAPEYSGDLTHTNSIAILHTDLPGVAPAGAVLLSVREIDRILILDPTMSRVLWGWGDGQLEGQHHATQIAGGNIMIFDNGVRKKQSRVIVVSPSDGRVVWSFTLPDFYTRLRGAAQKLPNGNVLATESDSGHAVEVTPRGEIVWEFWNPDVRQRKNGPPERAAIYRLLRYGKTKTLAGLLARH